MGTFGTPERARVFTTKHLLFNIYEFIYLLINAPRTTP